MSTPATAVQQRNVNILAEDRHGEFHARLHQRISDHAYGLFQRDSGQHGNHNRHWLQAENEVLRRVTEVREAGAWVAANAALANTDANDLQIMVLPDRAIVSGVKTTGGNDTEYLLIQWPVSIDPATAAAYVKGHTLTVTAKHASATPSEAATRSEASSFAPAEKTPAKTPSADASPKGETGPKAETGPGQN